jgi:hypothetical protein
MSLRFFSDECVPMEVVHRLRAEGHEVVILRKGIMAFQLHNHPESLPALLDRLVRYLNDHPNADQYRGRLFLIEPHRIRIRS